MTERRYSIKNRSRLTWRLASLLIVIFLVAVSFTVPPGAQAGKITRASAGQSTQVIENDLFLRGEQLTVDSTVNGDVFLMGQNASVRGDVNGSVFILARDANIQGRVSGNVYTLAITTRLGTGATIEQSLYTLSVNLLTEPGTQIGRDLNAYAVTANLQGAVTRDTHTVIGMVELLRLLRERGRLTVTGLRQTGQEPLTASTPMEFLWGTPRNVASGAGLPARGNGINRLTKPAGIAGIFQPYLQDATDNGVAVGQRLLNLFLSLVSFLVVGALALWLFPQPFARWAATVRARPWASAGYGALVLINGFLLPILIIVLIVSIVMGLIFISFPTIAWMILWTALGVLTAVFSIFLLVVTYLTKAIVAFLVGSLIMARVGGGTVSSNRWLALLLGLVIYVILEAIPYLGFAVGLIVTLLGLGAIWLVFRRRDAPVLPTVAA